MHLPDHIANLNSYSPPSPTPHPFPNIFGLGGSSQNQGGDQQRSGSGYQQGQTDVDLSLDAQLARQLELWTNTDFTFADDIGPFPGLEEFDIGEEGSQKIAEKEKKGEQNEDEMDMRELFEGKVRGMKGNKNVLMDRRREMEMEQQEKAANRNLNGNRETDQQSHTDVSVLASANRAAAAAVNNMSTPANPAVPPPTPSSLGLHSARQFAQFQQQGSVQQSQPQNQVNDLASFLSQFYNSHGIPSANASQQVQPQRQQPTKQQSVASLQFQLQQQSLPSVPQITAQAQATALAQNPSIAESLVQLLQGLTGQYNAQSQQQCPAPPVVMPQPIALSQNMSNVAQWIERQGPHDIRSSINSAAPLVPQSERPHYAQKRSFTVDEQESRYPPSKKARLPSPQPANDDFELKSIDLRDMSDVTRGSPSAPASAAGDSRRKNQAHGTPSRADIDLEPKSIPMGKGLVMVEGEIITHEEDKRRRNTAASARFRMKKKEREQALEKNTQALQDRVSQLEREMEGLRKENGWLRALVINGAPQPLSSPELQRASLSSASQALSKE